MSLHVGCYWPHPPSPCLVNIQHKSWCSFWCATAAGRLSWPGHCSNSVQPLPVVVYCSGCHDRQLPTITPQSDMIQLDHCDLHSACRAQSYHHHNRLWPFFWDHPGEPVPEENLWTLWCKGRLTEADTLTMRLGVVNLPLHHKVQKFSSGTGSPGLSRKKGRKTVVCVCVCVCVDLMSKAFNM